MITRLGKGDCRSGRLLFVRVGLSAGPAGDGVLKLIENLDIDIVGRTVFGYQFTESVFIVVFIGEF